MRTNTQISEHSQQPEDLIGVQRVEWILKRSKSDAHAFFLETMLQRGRIFPIEIASASR